MRTYQQTVDWLFANLPMFQRIGAAAYGKDLNNSVALAKYFDNPENDYPTIHIAGTNGKGSTSHMIASILQEAGYRVGLVTSPHLKDFRERIRVNGQLCSEEYVVNFVENHEQRIVDQKASFFEITTAMSFAYFKDQNVDVAVIETGMGGRLDSTNIIQPVLSVITNIALDHTQFLGDTLEAIAKEKGGIIKEDTPIVIGETTIETKEVFAAIAKEKNAPILFAEEQHFQDMESDLKGSYQIKNRRTVLTAVTELKKLGWEISAKSIENGLLKVINNTHLRGRWDVLGEQPLIVADTAHNPHGLLEVVKQIKKQQYNQLRLVLGFVNDKDVKESLSFFPKEAVYYFCEPNVPRKYAIDDLKNAIPTDLKNVNFFSSVEDAFTAAKIDSSVEDFIYIGGSTFVVAEVIEETE